MSRHLLTDAGGYDRRAIMRNAHKRFRDGRRLALDWTFAQCLRTAWAAARIQRRRIALNMLNAAMQRGPGNPTGANQYVKDEGGTFDNVQGSSAPTGNSRDAGLRRLRKAAEPLAARIILETFDSGMI